MARTDPRAVQETGFEKRRGVSAVEVRGGFTQLHVFDLKNQVMTERLRVLRAISEGAVSIDFLKFTPDGLSCLISSSATARVEQAMKGTGAHFELRPQRSIVLVHAVNMRDEEGLIASIVHRAIGTGVTIDHISDMHDRMLMIISEEDAAKVQELLNESLVAAAQDGRI